jgi:hypothetical protein
LADFALTPMEATGLRLRSMAGQQDEHRWVLEENGRLVAYARVVAQRRRLPHTVHVLALPGRDDLYQSLLAHAAEVFAAYPTRTILAWAADYVPEKQRALEAWGLKAFTVDHALVRDSVITLKLPTHANELGLADEKAFKPAFSQPPSA